MTLFDSLPQCVPFEFREANEKEKAAQIASGSEDARVALTMENMREAFLYVKKCCKAKIADDEIVSLCYTTLYRNAKRFKPGKIRFFAFAKVALRGAISDFWTGTEVVRNASKNYAPVYTLTLTKVGHRSEMDEEEEYSKNGLHSDLRQLTGMENGSLVPPVEPEFDLIHIRERHGIVKTIMERKLTDQERMIIDLVYTSGFTFEQIGNLLGVTGSAAENTHSTAMKKIRRELKLSGQLL